MKFYQPWREDCVRHGYSYYMYQHLNCGVTSKHVLSRNLNKAKNRLPSGALLGLILVGYVPLASQSPYPIIVYFVANYIPQLSHFLFS